MFGTTTRNYAFLLLVLLLAVELLCYMVGLNLQQKRILYRPVVGQIDEEYFSRRDPALGWPPVDTFNDSSYQHRGARLSPAFAGTAPQQACVSLYGDSFTWALEVDDEMAWGNQLARRLGCPVANYGVNGYGTDQAYLRFKQNQQDRAPVTILGITTENILRNVMQFKGIIYPKEEYSLKPRFILDESSGLRLVPLPDVSLNQYSALVRHPERYLEHDYFVPGGPSRIAHMSFPFSLTVATVLKDFIWHQLIHGGHVVDIVYEDFYREDHPSRALPITTAIAKAFGRDCREAGREPVIAVFPDRHSIDTFRRAGFWTYGTLLAELRKADIDVVDMGPPLLDRVGTGMTASLFKPQGHYNESVNDLLADHVHEFLLRSGSMMDSDADGCVD